VQSLYFAKTELVGLKLLVNELLLAAGEGVVDLFEEGFFYFDDGDLVVGEVAGVEFLEGGKEFDGVGRAVQFVSHA
jgi:hypothetical protein